MSLISQGLSPILAVSLGGALGASLRYGAVLAAQKTLGTGFPYGTLIVNVIGSGLIGIIAYGLFQRDGFNELWRLFFVTGLLGSFTTFSAFSLETIALAESDLWLKALTNVFSNIVLCITATVTGIWVAKQFISGG